MKKEGKLLRVGIIVFSIVLVIASMTILCYSEDNTGAMTMQGKVTSMDWVGSVLVVSNTTFYVPSNVEVVKGSSKISFSEVNVADNVTVTYRKSKNGSLKVIKIVVAYSGDSPA